MVLLASVLTFSFNNQTAWADLNPIVRVIPTSIELGPQDVIGQFLTIAVVVEDVAGLQSLSIEFAWNTTYLTYFGHTMTMPVDTYNSVQPPSPYAGILNGPYIMLAEAPDPPNGTYEVAMTTSGSPFIGSGTVFVMTFRVAYQPQPGEADVTLDWHFISIDLTDSQTNPISHQVQDGTVTIYAPEPEQPPSPPIGGTSVSIDLGKFSSWVTTTFLLVAVVIILNVKWNRRSKKH